MRIVIAEQEMVKKYHLGVATVLDVLGHPEALVTDDSIIYDFLDPEVDDMDTIFEKLRNLSRLSGVPVLDLEHRIWEVGKWIEGA